MDISFLKERINNSIDLKRSLLNDAELMKTVLSVSELMLNSLKAGGKVLFAGNGGSAADAQHLAAELSGRFYFDRKPLFALALHTNTSYLTAVANDYSYDYIYERLVVGMGRAGDVLVGLSTSGNSKNIVNAFKKAKELGLKTVAFTGASGGKLAEYSDFLLNVPSKDTPRIQELHIFLGHIICELVEKEYFREEK